MNQLREYAHLKKDEQRIAERWVRKAPIQGRREWDVHLPAVEYKLPEYWTKKDIANWHSLYDKRIDLVVHAKDAIWIMEITPKVSKAAIGGCIAYRDMYLRNFIPTKPVKLGIIVELDDPNYHPTLKALRIRLWVV